MKMWIIDGHNLVPKIPGLRLEDVDDETKLLHLLLDFCRISRSQAEVFFDGAPAGFIQKTNYGLVRIHSVRIGSTADDAIIAYLWSHQKTTRGMTVVSSDHRVQAEARALHAGVIRSEEFSIEIQKVLSSPQALQESREKILSPEEVAQWEELFRSTEKK